MTALDNSPSPLLTLSRPLSSALADGGVARGLFMLTGNSALAELTGLLGFDWAVLDMEASPMSKQDAFHCVQALTGSRCSPVVRVPYLSRHHIEHALDIGAHGVLIPKVDTVRAATAAAAACRYPPDGERGINPVRASGYFGNMETYLSQANQATYCIVQIESAEAVENVDRIVFVPGVDAIFIGMGDLASAFRQPGEMTGPLMDKARTAVLDAARRSGKHAGIFAYSLDLARQYIEEGFSLVAVGNDIKFFREAAMLALAEVPKCQSAGDTTPRSAGERS
jgi:2-keto-3-deoxy-L-rhamnonate aldolase RhmA